MASPPSQHSLPGLLRSMAQPKNAAMFGLGFSSGLPFLLTGATFGYWLREAGTTLTAIGFISWVGLAYTFKFFWAPLVDRLPLPWFGQRRGWALLTQALVGAGLLGMSIVGPNGPGGLVGIGAFALLVAFASATQDIAVDAWRIEAAADPDELGLFTALAQLGYRAALLVTDALILVFAQSLGWPLSYAIMALFMGVGVIAALTLAEPVRSAAARQNDSLAANIWTLRGFADSIAGPLIAFFRAHGAIAALLLLMISLYRLPEFLIGPVAGPFYADLGLRKDVVGGIRASVGLVSSLIGISAGGFCALRLGYLRTLILGAILQGVGVSAYALVALFGPDLRLFGLAMATDNFCYAFGGVALITYMSSLTSLGYTATQYAILSSAYTLFGKWLKGFSGAVVDSLHQHYSLMQSYAYFYIGAGLVCLPALLLCFWIAAYNAGRAAKTEPAAA